MSSVSTEFDLPSILLVWDIYRNHRGFMHRLFELTAMLLKPIEEVSDGRAKFASGFFFLSFNVFQFSLARAKLALIFT